MATIDDFEKLDIRAGKVIAVEEFPEARKPAWKLTIDFGAEIGIKKSSAQLTHHYTKEQLLNRMVMGVTNFPPRQIGPFVSEVLVVGVPDQQGKTVLVVPEKTVFPGAKLY
ncbi:MAG TPA: tRNA-binding protein [Bacteroidales bacterium]|nr:tRNA-binding protein [Bacteroidales bacterium]HRX95415.1 tRNA-binding protein [Bacteroidales bacterium]